MRMYTVCLMLVLFISSPQRTSIVKSPLTVMAEDIQENAQMPDPNDPVSKMSFAYFIQFEKSKRKGNDQFNFVMDSFSKR